MQKSFGPAVVHDGDSFRAMCCSSRVYCTFLHGRTCSHVRPAREIPDIKNTPDWCEMREGMLRDAAAMAAKEAQPQPGRE